MKRRPPEVIRIPADSRVWRFGDVYSVHEDGDFWRNRLGSRRAWSTRYAAEVAVADEMWRRAFGGEACNA